MLNNLQKVIKSLKETMKIHNSIKTKKICQELIGKNEY